MFDFMITLSLIGLAIVIGVDCYRKWAVNKSIWYLLAVIAALLAALAALQSWGDSLFMSVLALLLRVPGRRRVKI